MRPAIALLFLIGLLGSCHDSAFLAEANGTSLSGTFCVCECCADETCGVSEPIAIDVCRQCTTGLCRTSVPVCNQAGVDMVVPSCTVRKSIANLLSVWLFLVISLCLIVLAVLRRFSSTINESLRAGTGTSGPTPIRDRRD